MNAADTPMLCRGGTLGHSGIPIDQCETDLKMKDDDPICTTLTNCTFLPLTISRSKFVGKSATSVDACLRSLRGTAPEDLPRTVAQPWRLATQSPNLKVDLKHEYVHDHWINQFLRSTT